MRFGSIKRLYGIFERMGSTKAVRKLIYPSNFKFYSRKVIKTLCDRDLFVKVSIVGLF